MSTAQKPLLSVVLPLELKNNNTGRGNAFWSSAKQRKEYEAALRTLGQTRQPFEYRVGMVITRILGPKQRLWDADSVTRGSAKELVDSLVACGWFNDDGPKWIGWCDGRQDSSQRENGPAVMVEVWKDE